MIPISYFGERGCRSAVAQASLALSVSRKVEPHSADTGCHLAPCIFISAKPTL